MGIKLMLLNCAIVFCANCASATEGVSICYARSNENNCIEASARLEIDHNKKTFVLFEHFEGIKCWSPDMPKDQAGKIVETRGFNGSTGYQFVTTNNEIVGTVLPDRWTATYSGAIDGFYFSRCSID